MFGAAKRGDAHGLARALAALGLEKPNIEQCDMDGYTALCWAAFLGHDECVKLLLSNGANAMACLPNGETPLLFALLADDSKQLPCVRLLLAARARVDAETISPAATPLQVALESRDRAICSLLLVEQEAAAVRILPSERGAIHVLAYNLATAKVRRKLGAVGKLQGLVARPDLNGGIVEVMDATAQAGRVAVRVRSTGECLRAKRESLHLYDEDLAALLSLALQHGHSPDGRDMAGYSPIHLAIEHGCEPAVSILLAARADVSVKDPLSGVFNAISFAAANGERGEREAGVQTHAHLAVVDAFISAGVSLAGALSAAALALDITVARRLLKAGSDPNEALSKADPGSRGQTPLVLLLENSESNDPEEVDELCELLLESQADPNAAADTGMSALMQASHHGQLECVQRLLACQGILSNACCKQSWPDSCAIDNGGCGAACEEDCTCERMTALTFAEIGKHRKIAKALALHVAKAELAEEDFDPEEDYCDRCAACDTYSGQLYPYCYLKDEEILLGPRFDSCCRCQAVRYCGEECQKADWPLHKARCPVLAAHGGCMYGVAKRLAPPFTAVCDMTPAQRVAAFTANKAALHSTPQHAGMLAEHGAFDSLRNIYEAVQKGEIHESAMSLMFGSLEMEAEGQRVPGLERARAVAAKMERKVRSGKGKGPEGGPVES